MKRTMCAIAAAGLLTIAVGVPGSQARGMKVGELDEAKVMFEENTTDGDLGFHFKVDGDAWKRVLLFGPGHRLVVNTGVSGGGGLFKVGLTELFSESAEPGYDDLPREEFLSYFREGEYRFVAVSLEGGLLVGEAELTKNIPVGAEVTHPQEDEVVDPDADLVVQWEPVPDPDAPNSVIEFYEVVVETDEDEGLFQVLTVILPSDATSFTVPAEFLMPGAAYKVEIISEETSNNRSAVEVPFETDDLE